MKCIYVNLTPHAINLNDGREFPKSGKVARIEETYSTIFEIVDDRCKRLTGKVIDLPDPIEGVRYIVSGMILSYLEGKGRDDVVAPATGHPDCKRNSQGHIVSVPCFI